MNVEKANIGDVQQMHELINRFANKGKMLPRALSELYENLRDFFVIRDNDKVIACVSLHISWVDLAEIRSMAVSEERQSQGISSMLINACMKEAETLGIPMVFCLTYQPLVFEKHNFKQIDKLELPRKVWTECFRCPKFPDCDEIALIYKFDLDSK